MSANTAGPAYLRRLFANTTGLVSLSWWVTPDQASPRSHSGDLDSAAHRASLMNGDLHAAYVRMTTLTRHPDAGRGGDDLSHEAVALFADLDFGADGHAQTTKGDRRLPVDEAEARTIIDLSGLPAPTMWVHSGGGLYPIWQFSDPWVLSDDADRAAFDRLNTRWNQQLESGAASADPPLWYAPQNKDLSRILRLPGTVNHKTDTPRDCRLLSDDGPTYTVEQLSALLDNAEVSHGVTVPPSVATSHTGYSTEEREQFEFRDAVTEYPIQRLHACIGFDGLLKSKGWTECPCDRTDAHQHWTRPGDDVSEPHSAHLPLVTDPTTGQVSEVDSLVVLSSSTDLPTLTGLSFGTVLASLYDLPHDDWGAVARTITEWEGQPDNPFADLGWGADAREAGWHRVFASTPRLRHIQQSGHASGAGATMLLGSVLARVSAALPLNVLLPGKADGSVGTRLPLNYAVVLCAGSGVGKSAAFGESRDLIPNTHRMEAPSGTGEGIQRAYLEQGVDDEGRKKLVLKDDPRLLFFVDEIKELVGKSKSSESIVIPTLCTMVMGGLAGTTLASDGQSRVLPANQYRFAMVVGAQPENSEMLLADVNSGTPQRFLWVPGQDPTLTMDALDTRDPGGLDWEPPVNEFDDVLEVDPAILRHIRTARLLRALSPENRPDGAPEPDPRESHLLLLQLKTAALLALLHDEKVVTHQWWELAAELVRLSLLEQQRCLDVLASGARREADQRAEREGRSTVIRDTVVRTEMTKRERMRARVLGYLSGDSVSASDLRRKVKSTERELFDSVMSNLVAEGTVELDDKEYRLTPPSQDV